MPRHTPASSETCSPVHRKSKIDDQKLPTEVLVIRHAETFGNVEGRFCGHSETELTPLGILQARALGERLRGQQFDHAYSSDLSRALHTARLALEHHHQPIEPLLDPRLREMYYGDWESLAYTELSKTQAEALRAWFTGKSFSPPGGESLQDVRNRTAEAIRELVSKHTGERLLIASHGQAIGAMVAELLQVPLESTWSFGLANTAITKLSFSRSGRVTLVGFNDHAHIEGLTAE